MGAPKVAVLGAGSVGCFIGGCWQAAGLPVTFVGRPRLAKDIAEYGLSLSDYEGWQSQYAAVDVDYTVDPARLAGAEIIALTVKSGDTPAAAALISEHGTAGATVISFQNGISNVDVLELALGDRFEVVRGMVPYNVAYLGEGRFHKGVAGTLHADERESTLRLTKFIGDGPAALKLSRDMLGLAWGKLLINLNNAVNALSGRTLLEELQQRDYRRVFAASMREGLGLLERAGIQPVSAGPVALAKLPKVIDTPDWLFNRFILKRWKIDGKARSSMADDLAGGRKTEVDYLNGELVRLADRLQQRAPVNRAILELVHQAEAGRDPFSAAELRTAAMGR